MTKAEKRCRECGAPSFVARTLVWNSDGTITQRRDPQHRLILFESDNLDRLWARLAESLGVTLEHIQETVIESKSRATRAFLGRTLPWYANLMARFIGYRIMISQIETQGLAMGYGKITIGGQSPRRGRPERITVLVEDPYSLPLFCGDFKGAAEVLERRLAEITYQALDARRHQIDVTMSRHRLEEEGPGQAEHARLKAGDVEYDRCPVCGVPRELKQFNWDLRTGIIRDTVTERRMAIFGTSGMLAVFEEMVHELGERVLDNIVEIESENAGTTLSTEEAQSGFEGLRSRAAIRGLGLLTRLDFDESVMTMMMSNPSIPVYIVGVASGIFELATGHRGSASWDLVGEGDLLIKIKPES